MWRGGWKGRGRVIDSFNMSLQKGTITMQCSSHTYKTNSQGLEIHVIRCCMLFCIPAEGETWLLE